MLKQNAIDQAHLAVGWTDMRKSIDGLAAIVQERFSLSPFSTSLFVFCGRKRDRLKILYWDHNGFWLLYRRLEKGKFQWPTDKNKTAITISGRELNWLLDGLAIQQKQAHPKVTATLVV